jgi:hypothetical protein
LGEFRSHCGIKGNRASTGRHKFKVLKRKVQRALAVKDRRIQLAEGKLSALATAWNRDKLRRGDRADSHLERKRQARGVGKGHISHPNAWTYKGTVVFAFRQIGSHNLSAVRVTRRELDAVAVTSLACRDHQMEACGEGVQRPTVPTSLFPRQNQHQHQRQHQNSPAPTLAPASELVGRCMPSR